MDLAESETEYLVKLEASGRNTSGVEREEGRFMRTVRLPGAVQEEKIDAVYHDGILTARMPTAEPPVKNRIAIK